MAFLPDLTDRLADLARRHRIPGAAIAVRHGADYAEAATGVLNLVTGVETTTNSLFHIGSVGKMYTALLVMQLVEEGLVDLDQPVRRYLPEFRLADEDAAAAVTVRHLLTHTGGFEGDLFEDTGRGDDCLDRYVAYLAGARQFAAPGELFSYCNSGYCVLGALTARLRASTWEDAIRTRLLLPLATTHTTLYAEEAVKFRAATGHFEDPQTNELNLSPLWTLPRSVGPAGASVSAAPRDLLRFGRLFVDGGRTRSGVSIVAPETIAAMTAPAVRTLNMPVVSHWGLGVAVLAYRGARVLGHSGSLRGQNSYLRIVPEHDVVIAGSANGGSAAQLDIELIDGLITELTGAVAPPDPVPPQRPSIVDVTSLLGLYEGPMGRFRVAAARDGIDVTSLPSPAAIALGDTERTHRFVHYDGDMFVTAEGKGGSHSIVTFVGGGRFLHNSRAHPRVTTQL